MRLVQGVKVKEIGVIKQGNIRNSIMSTDINQAPYIEYFLGKFGGYLGEDLKLVSKINEEEFTMSRKRFVNMAFWMALLPTYIIVILYLLSFFQKIF